MSLYLGSAEALNWCRQYLTICCVCDLCNKNLNAPNCVRFPIIFYHVGTHVQGNGHLVERTVWTHALSPHTLGTEDNRWTGKHLNVDWRGILSNYFLEPLGVSTSSVRHCGSTLTETWWGTPRFCSFTKLRIHKQKPTTRRAGYKDQEHGLQDRKAEDL